MILMAIIVIVLLISSLVVAEPQLIYTKHGIYGHPSDDTGQCLPEYRLCIGNEYSARNNDYLRGEGITHVVSAIGTIGIHLPWIRYHVFEVEDGNVPMEEYWKNAYRFIDEALEADPQNKVFIHCAAGVSRSSSTLIYYLIRKFRMPYGEAYSLVKAARHVIQPNKRFERDLSALAEAWKKVDL